MDRVFLDANVLFSAAWRPSSGLAALWRLPATELVTSAYAIAEAMVNLPDQERRKRLQRLVRRIWVVPERHDITLPEEVNLPDKDRPILLAAIHVGARYLLTGDKKHFGPYFGRKLAGVAILTPAQYLNARSR